MDEPASPTTETLVPQRQGPRPLMPLQKKIYAVLGLLGLVLVGLTFYLGNANLPGFVIGVMAGGGGSLLAVACMRLFHRPDR